MNILDFAILLFLVLGALVGWYHGLVRAGANALAVLLAMVLALCFCGGMARRVEKKGKLIPQLLNYSETDALIADVDLARTPVEGLDAPALNELMADVRLPYPVDQRFRENVARGTFLARGIVSVNDTLAMTITHLSVNIGCFEVLFVILLAALLVAVHGLDVVLQFPILRHGDGPAGALVGIFGAVFLLIALAAVIPVGLSYVPFEEITAIVDKSAACAFFYRSNFILQLMKGFIA